MLVDPSTGLPIDEGTNPRSLSGVYGTGVGQGLGVGNPLYYDAMEAIPRASTMVGWNMRRTQNTLLKNKTSSRFNRNAGGLRQTFSPLRFNSLADVGNIDPVATGIKRNRRWRTTKKLSAADINTGRISGARMNGKTPYKFDANIGGFRKTTFDQLGGRIDRLPRDGYTPFNVLAGDTPVLGGEWWAKKFGGELQPGQRYFAPGALGTMATSATIMGNGQLGNLGKVAAAAGRFGGEGVDVSAFGRNLARGMGPSGGFISGGSKIVTQNFQMVNRGSFAAGGLGAARWNNVKFGGKVAGYFEGAQAARMGQGNLRSLQSGSESMRDAFRGANKKMGTFYDDAVGAGASAWANSGRFGAARILGSRGTSVGLRALGPLSTALLVHDLAMFGGKMVGRGLRLGIEGIKSAQGDLTKSGPFGMGYRDNSVAATSRQRGVMAISNSRLNARSALGQEAAMLHQAFG